MNNKIKIILSYLIQFISSIILFILGIFILFKFTVLNKKYIINILDKTNYYEKMYESIKTEMSYYTNQSGFEDNILDDTFTIKEVTTNINTYITNFYNGKKTKIDSSDFETKLNKKIDLVLEDKNFTIANRSEIDKFIEEMGKIYKSKIKIINGIDNYASKFHKIINYSNKIIILLSITLILLYFINDIVFKRKNISIILYTTVFLTIAINIYIRSRIDIKYIFIYNELLSMIIIKIINNLLKYSLYAATIYFIIGLINDIFLTNKRRK